MQLCDVAAAIGVKDEPNVADQVLLQHKDMPRNGIAAFDGFPNGSEKAEAGQPGCYQAGAGERHGWNIAICAVSISVSLGAAASDTTTLASRVSHGR